MNEVTIAFVLSNGGCDTTQDIEQNAADVKAFVAKGGHVKASFGGADGTYVEAKCSDAAALATAIEDFVDATGITDLDFDVEQDAVMTDTVNALRGQALKLAQDAKGIQVAFTLPANPSPNGGLTSQGLSVVSHAIGAGVNVWHVNLMTMDYGDSFGGKPLAPVAIGSLTDCNAQLLSIVPGLTKAGAWAMIGVIPMIGKNDDSEVFSLADAKTLATFATTNDLGLMSFWSIDRDQVCPSGADYNSCSTVDGASFAFNAVAPYGRTASRRGDRRNAVLEREPAHPNRRRRGPAEPHQERDPRPALEPGERRARGREDRGDPLGLGVRGASLNVERVNGIERDERRHRVRDEPAPREREPRALHRSPHRDVRRRVRAGRREHAHPRRALHEPARARPRLLEDAHRGEPVLRRAPERVERHPLGRRELHGSERDAARHLLAIAHVEADRLERGVAALLASVKKSDSASSTMGPSVLTRSRPNQSVRADSITGVASRSHAKVASSSGRASYM